LIIADARASLLEAFIEGFVMAKGVDSMEWRVIGDFRQWLHKIPGVTPGPSIAGELISLVGTDEAAFQEFFEKFEQFLLSRPSKMALPRDVEFVYRQIDGQGHVYQVTVKNGIRIHTERVPGDPGVTKREF